MWKLFIFNNNNYIFKLIVSSENLKFYLYDFNTVWSEELSNDLFLSRCHELNPLLEVNLTECTGLLRSLLKSVNIKWLLEPLEHSDRNDLTLLISSKLQDFGGVSFKFKINLTKQDSKTFSREIFIPILLSFDVKEEREDVLCDLLAKKDAEIMEYRLTYGADIVRVENKTEPFQKDSLVDNENSLHCDISGENKEYFDCLTNKYQVDVNSYKRARETKVENEKEHMIYKPPKKFCLGLQYDNSTEDTKSSIIKSVIKEEQE